MERTPRASGGCIEHTPRLGVGFVQGNTRLRVGIVRCLVAGALLGALFGCAARGPLAPPGELPGLSGFKVESFRVWVRHDPKSGRELSNDAGPAAEIDLRVGERFQLADARRTLIERYTLLNLASGVAQLRLDRYDDRRDQREAIRRESRVVRYSSWPPDDTPQAGLPAEVIR